MRFIVYAGDETILNRLLKKIPPAIPKAQMEVYHTLSHLSQGFKCSIQPDDPAVIAAANREELREISELKEFIRDLRTILILPDTKQETFSIGLTLYPRFISYIDSDFEDVAAVLNKMIELYHSRDRAIYQGHINGIQSHEHQ